MDVFANSPIDLEAVLLQMAIIDWKLETLNLKSITIIAIEQEGQELLLVIIDVVSSRISKSPLRIYCLGAVIIDEAKDFAS